MKRALIVVDVQNDFCREGSLEVPDGDDVVPVINSIMDKFDVVIATQDWHPANHKSFAMNHEDKKPFEMIKLGGKDQVLWPAHCVQAMKGAMLHSGLKQDKIQVIIRKGMNPEIDSYSAFADNAMDTVTGLDALLTSLDIEEVYVCGLATDYCVKATALDAAQLYDAPVFVILDASKGVATESTVQAIEEMKASDIKLVSSKEI